MTGCASCSGTSNCLKCKPKFFLTPNKKCESCMENCAECPSSSQCDICLSRYFLNFNRTCVENCVDPYWGESSSGTCVEKCKLSEFESEGPNRLCLKCSYTCKTCSKNFNNCTSCEYPYFLNNITNSCQKKCSDDLWGNLNQRTCDASCQNNEYEEILDQTCRPCDSNCTTCKDKPNFCTSCSASSDTFLNKINYTCVYVCPINFWSDQTKRECLELGCDPHIIIDDAKKLCKSKCEVDEYLTIEANLNVCKKCSTSIKNCSSCANSTTCTSCSNNLYLVKEKKSPNVNCSVCDFLQRAVGSPGKGRH
jgi:proprotein convertase subtilisin/kexin type 5